MTKIVTIADCSVINAYSYATDAATIGIAPGVLFPEKLETTFGNGQPFVKFSRLEAGGARYKQAFGCIVLDVFND
jgi:hypothetical protein